MATKAKASQVPRGFVTRQQAADLMGVTLSHFANRYRAELGGEGDRKKISGQWYYRGRRLFEVYTPNGQNVGQNARVERKARDRSTELRNQMLEMDVAEKRRALLPAAEVRAAWGLVSELIRNGVNRLQKKCGSTAFELMTETLDGADSAIAKLMEKVDK